MKIDELRSLFTCNFIKKRPWHRCIPVNFAKFLRTSFFIEHLRWIFLFYTFCLKWWGQFLSFCKPNDSKTNTYFFLPSSCKSSDSNVSQYILLSSYILNNGTATPDVLIFSYVNELMSENAKLRSCHSTPFSLHRFQTIAKVIHFIFMFCWYWLTDACKNFIVCIIPISPVFTG